MLRKEKTKSVNYTKRNTANRSQRGSLESRNEKIHEQHNAEGILLKVFVKIFHTAANIAVGEIAKGSTCRGPSFETIIFCVPLEDAYLVDNHNDNSHRDGFGGKYANLIADCDLTRNVRY